MNVFLSHYAHAIWDKKHRGSVHLYGHSHGGAEEWLNEIMPGRRSMDVEVDSVAKLFGGDSVEPHHYRPISFDEIMRIMPAFIPPEKDKKHNGKMPSE